MCWRVSRGRPRRVGALTMLSLWMDVLEIYGGDIDGYARAA